MGTNLDPKSKVAGHGPQGKERRPVIMTLEPIEAAVGPRIEPVEVHDQDSGFTTRIDTAGRGEPLVVLNGLLGLNRHWFECVPPLADRARCVFVEPPLLNLTGEHCSVAGVVRLVIHALDALALGPAVLAGNSLGGHVAMRIALARPDLVRGLVLIGSSGLFERGFERNVMHAPTRDWLAGKIRDLFCDPGRMPPGMVDEAYAELSQRRHARALVKLGKSAKNDHLGEALPSLRVPTMVLWGKQDNVTPPEVAEEFRGLIHGAQLRWIDRCGHAPQIERPDAVAEALGDFLRSLALPGGARL